MLFADQQFSTGNYDLAIKELLRINYFCGQNNPDVQLKLANSFYEKGDWKTARLYYDQAYRLADSDSILIQARLRKISSLVLENNYKQALIDLYNIHDSVYAKHQIEIDLLYAICHFGLEDFEKSEEYFKKMVGDDEVAKLRIDSVFNEKKLFNRPKPGLAYTMSMIIPGSGQIYSGDVGEGLNSFLLTEAFLVLGLVIMYNYSIIDAIVVVLPWYQRYFLGGLENTLEVARKERQQNRSDAYNKILEIVKSSLP